MDAYSRSATAELPLLDGAGRHGFTLLVASPQERMPARAPQAGEQYRFHFDMAKCIGCKCCVVACNEQNGNPAEINWRRVGEIEGGVYPAAQRWHVSMGCNHCLEPSCLIGCPVEAYTKDAVTGIVDHDADACIGCQYCTWNCSYGVPQFNEARGVVGKCDMCHGRLSRGSEPACVGACPEGAIAIEIVDMAAWRRDHALADAPGMPSSSDSLSTTRVTMPAGAIAELARVDGARIEPGHPHWSLVMVLVGTQLSVGGAIAVWLVEALGGALASWAALVPLVVGMIALGAAPLHLGRPAFAYRAIRNWRRSWLSREILGLSAFAGAASAYAAALFLDLPFRAVLGGGAAAAGMAGVYCSARIYMVAARPAWNLGATLAGFYLTCAVLGPRVALASGAAATAWLYAAAAMASAAQEIQHAIRLRSMRGSAVMELRESARLLDGALRAPGLLRIALAVVALVSLPFAPAISLAFALAAEIAGRWLFFTGVVPKSVASTFLTPKGGAR